MQTACVLYPYGLGCCMKQFSHEFEVLYHAEIYNMILNTVQLLALTIRSRWSLFFDISASVCDTSLRAFSV